MKRMNKIGRTILAGMTACTMGFTGIGVYAEEGETKPESGTGKDETVYVITDASGDKQSVIVSDWLKNTERSGTLLDESSLKDIENVSGNETYERNADGTITWKANGKDIYYRGTSDADLPVSMKISYKLDGKDISAKDIAGKAGHVIVRFDYTNDTEQTITVNGRTETVKVPFAMITGVQIDPEKFSNINVTNGKLISEGSNSFLVGIAFPGLKESLNTSELSEKISDNDIPDYVEFEADTTGFELGMTMTVAGNNLLNDLSIDGDADMSELSGKMDQLMDAADQLNEGTQTLKDGTGALREGADKLKDGASQLKDGTGKVKDGSEQLNDGAGKLADGTSALKDGTGELAEGAGTLAEGTGTLNEGAKQIDAGAASLKDGAKDLAAGTKQLAKGSAALSAGAQTLKDGTEQAVTGSEKLAAGAQSVADGAKQLQDGVTALKDGIEKSANSTTPSLKDGAADMSSQIDAKVKELEGQKAALEQLKNGLFQEVGETDDHANDQVLLVQYQAVLDAAKNVGKAQAEAAAAQKQGLMQKTIDRQSDTISDQQETIDSLKEENEALKTQTESVETETANETAAETDDNTAALQAQVAELQSQLNAAKAENSDLQNQIGSLQGEKDSLQGELDAANGTIASLNDQVASLSAENESLKAAQTAEAPAEEPVQTAAKEETAEDMLVLMENETAPETLADAMKKLNEAKEAYNATVTALLANEGTDDNDALLVSQIDQTIVTLDSTITNLTALKNGADQISKGIIAVDKGVNELAAGFAGDPTAKKPGLVDGAIAVANGAKALSDGATKLDAGAENLKDGIGQIAAGAGSVNEGAGKVAAGANALKTGIDSLSAGADQVNTGAGALKTGADKLNSGASDLNDGAKTLYEGTGDLKDGTAELDNGASELLNGVIQLDDGAVQLDDGTETLLEGMEKFKSEGIDKLAEVFGGELEDVLDRLTAISDAGTAYRSFSGTSENENDSVKFIFKTESVKAD